MGRPLKASLRNGQAGAKWLARGNGDAGLWRKSDQARAREWPGVGEETDLSRQGCGKTSVLGRMARRRCEGVSFFATRFGVQGTVSAASGIFPLGTIKTI